MRRERARAYILATRSTATRSNALDQLVTASQSGVCDPAAARERYALGPDAVTLALLAAAQRITELQAQTPGGVSPSTPSAPMPVCGKPNATTRWRQRRKRPGAQAGHPGHHRPVPPRIAEHKEHRLRVCPCCGGPLQRRQRRRTRLIEDLPENLASVVTEHTIHRDYCPKCKQHVDPVVPDALPNVTFRHRLVSFASWWHYALGVTLDQLIDILQFHLRTKLSAGGLSAAWQRLAEILTYWYEQLAEEAQHSAYLHADEIARQVQGQTCWLWCCANAHLCYYLIDRARGSLVWQRLFGEACDGTASCCTTSRRRTSPSPYGTGSTVWCSCRVNWRKSTSTTPRRSDRRLPICCADHLYTFLDNPQIPFENNFAQRTIRPDVLLRKSSQSNRSGRGALTQAVLMSINRTTLRLRGHDPLRTITDALQTYLQTGQLPLLPAAGTANG